MKADWVFFPPGKSLFSKPQFDSKQVAEKNNLIFLIWRLSADLLTDKNLREVLLHSDTQVKHNDFTFTFPSLCFDIMSVAGTKSGINSNRDGSTSGHSPEFIIVSLSTLICQCSGKQNILYVRIHNELSVQHETTVQMYSSSAFVRSKTNDPAAIKQLEPHWLLAADHIFPFVSIQDPLGAPESRSRTTIK